MKAGLMNEQREGRRYPGVSFYAVFIACLIFNGFKDVFDSVNSTYSPLPLLIGFSITIVFMLFAVKLAFQSVIGIQNNVLRRLNIFLFTVGAGVTFGFLAGGMYGLLKVGFQ